MTAAAGLLLAALVAVVAVSVLAVLRQPPRLRRRLLTVLLVALCLRVALALLLHGLGSWQITMRGAVTPDEAVIDFAARLRAAGDSRSPVLLGGSLHTVWLLVAAAVFELWNSLLALKLVNAVLGTLLVVSVFFLGREVASDRVGLYAAWGVALFPTAVVWSALALREPLIALVITTLLLVVLRLLNRPGRPLQVAAALASVAVLLLVLGFTRSYMVPLLIVLLLAAAVAASAQQRAVGPLLRGIAAGAVAIGLIAVVPNGTDLIRTTLALAGEQAPTVYNPFSDCSDESACAPAETQTAAGAAAEIMQRTGGTAPAPGAQPLLSESLQSVGQKGLVRALAIAVLAGRPVWRTDEFFFLLQPGVLAWWALVPLIATGAFLLLRRRSLPETALISGLCGTVVLFLAYSGQFVRHHYMLEPPALVLAAVGAVALLDPARRRSAVAVGVASAVMLVAGLASVGASLL